MNIKTKKIVDFYLGNLLIFSLRPLVYVLGKILNKSHTPTVAGDIVFIKLLGGGSLVLAYPSILGIRKKYPQSNLILVTTKSVQPFAEFLNVFDQIKLIDDRDFVGMTGSALSAWSACLGVDTVIDLEVYSKLSTVFSLFTMARNRIGFFMEDIFWRKHINTHLIYFNRFSGSYQFYEQVAFLIDAVPESHEQCRLELSTILGTDEKKSKTKVQIAIGFACSDFGQERMLSAQQWETFFKRRIVAPEKYRFVFLGGREDSLFAEKIIHTLQKSFPAGEFVNAAGKLTLKDSVKTLWNSDEFWGIDSSLLHLSRLGGIKTTSFWGPTDPQTRLKPIDGLQEETFYEKIPCSPCIHVTDTPPCKGQNKCIAKLFDPDLNVDSQHLLFTAWPSKNQSKSPS